jgi:cell division protein FtsB
MGAPMKPAIQPSSKEKIKPAIKGSWLGDMWREHSNILLVLLCSILLLQDVFGAHGMIAMRQSQRETARVRHEIQLLDNQNRQAQQRIHELQTNPATIECMARAGGLARPGEVVFGVTGTSGESAEDADAACFPQATPPAQSPQSAATPSPPTP